MSRYYIFDIPTTIKEGLQPFKLNVSEYEPEVDESSEESCESGSEDDEAVKPKQVNFSSAVTKYNDSYADESLEDWQWANRAHITGSPFVYFVNPVSIPEGKVLLVYKSWFDLEILQTAPVAELESLPLKGQSCILMVGSGHFAGAIFKHKRLRHKTNLSNPAANIQMLVSKTFHRYTTRRKQGGAQSASDAAHGKANSAGSTIRRANERVLQEEIKALLASWAPELAQCHRIFFRAPGRGNKQLIAGYPDAPIAANSPKLVRIPFASGRPTMNECKSAWLQLTQVLIVDAPKPPPVAPVEPKKSASNTPQQSREPTPEPEDPEVVRSTKITDLIGRSKLPALKTILNNDIDFKLQPCEKYTAYPTPLLYAAHNDKHNVVSQLLLWGASPLIKNDSGQYLGDIAKGKKTKEALQVVRGTLGESKWDWKRAKVGLPTTREDLLARETKEKLRINEENRKLEEEREKQEHAAKMEKLIAKHGAGRLTGGLYEASRGLSETDLRQVERERRARAAEARTKR